MWLIWSLQNTLTNPNSSYAKVGYPEIEDR
jgi:hypothetical protein